MQIKTPTYSQGIELESHSNPRLSSDELSIHSSDDELDEYIIASPKMIHRTKALYSLKKDQQSCNQHSESDHKKEKFFYDEIIKSAYFALGLDVLGPELRKIQLLEKKPSQSKILRKRGIEDLDFNAMTRNMSLKKLKIKRDSVIKLESKENRIESFYIERTWIEKIFDDLTEMNKILIRKLQKEFKLASKSCKISFQKTFLMLLQEFKDCYYDHSLCIKDNLINFINLLTNFYQSNVLLKTNLNSVSTHFSSLDIE